MCNVSLACSLSLLFEVSGSNQLGAPAAQRDLLDTFSGEVTVRSAEQVSELVAELARLPDKVDPATKPLPPRRLGKAASRIGEGDLRTRVADLLTALGQSGADGDAWLAARRGRWIMGSPDEARERVRALQRAYVDVWATQIRLHDPSLSPEASRTRAHVLFGLLNSLPAGGFFSIRGDP